MVDGQAQGFAQVVAPGPEVLTGQAVDKVKADVVAPLAQQVDGPVDVGRPMASADDAEGIVVERLHAHAQPVDGRIG